MNDDKINRSLGRRSRSAQMKQKTLFGALSPGDREASSFWEGW
ncbi:MAG: hypothetical protein ACLQO6_04820 [Desulfomonilaceae bacterium]